MTKYIDIYSGNRNRTEWNLPAEFDIVFSSTSKQVTGPTAIDSVSLAAPTISWTGMLFNTTSPGAGSITVTTLPATFLGNATSLQRLIVTGAGLQRRDNYYRNAVLKHATKPLFAIITSFTWLHDNVYEIEIDKPVNVDYSTSFIINDPSDFQNTLKIFIFIPSGSTSPDSYVYWQITNETLDQDHTIVSYKNGIACVENCTGWLATHNFTLREIPNNEKFTIMAGSTTSELLTDLPGRDVDYYTGDFVRILKPIYDSSNTAPFEEIRRVIAYDGVTTTLESAFSANVSGLFGEYFYFSNENFIPILFKQERANPIYSISLLRLIIPNKPIIEGGRVCDQSYFYVELSDPNSSLTHVIDSNNPSSFTSIFTCIVPNIPEKNRTKFIVTSGEETVNIPINLTSLHFKITSPTSGQVLQFTEQDTTSPFKPNPDLQIRALFRVSLN